MKWKVVLRGLFFFPFLLSFLACKTRYHKAVKERETMGTEVKVQELVTREQEEFVEAELEQEVFLEKVQLSAPDSAGRQYARQIERKSIRTKKVSQQIRSQESKEDKETREKRMQKRTLQSLEQRELQGDISLLTPFLFVLFLLLLLLFLRFIR